MAFTEDGINLMLEAIRTGGVKMGLTNAADTELSGGDPAYARKDITWAAASGKAMALNGTLPTFDCPAGAEVRKVIICASGGTIYTRSATTEEDFTAQGTYTITSGTLSGA